MAGETSIGKAVDVAGSTVVAVADDVLIDAGNALDKGGFTVVGRYLQKHGSRAGGVFPKATGNISAINAQGEATLRGILTNPNITSVTRPIQDLEMYWKSRYLAVKVPGLVQTVKHL